MTLSRRVVLAWIPVVVMIAVIILESMELSANKTGGMLRPVLDWLWVTVRGHHIGWHTFDVVHFVIRKVGHFVGYGLMCYFFFRAWRITFQERQADPLRSARWFWDRRWAVLALLGTFAVASGDEIHQTFDATRTGAFHDVVLDCAGGAVALGIAWMSAQRRKRLATVSEQGD